MKQDQILNQLWNRQLDVQVSMVRESDIDFFSKLRYWRKAKNILEVGAGNGEYLCSLAASFPKKRFLGVDLNPSLIRRAITRSEGLAINNVKFMAHDFFALVHLPPRYDLILARLVVQHLPDLERFARTVAELLNPGGTLIIVEAEDERIEFNPPVPKAKALLKTIRKKQPGGVSPVNVIRAFRRKARSMALSVVRDDSRIYPLGTGRKALVRRFFGNMSRLAQALYGIDPKTPQLEDELRKWASTKGSAMNFACRFVIFRKRRWRWLALFF